MAGKKILICGAGSIGIFLGAKLHSKGHDVYLVGRRKLREAGDDKVLINGEEYDIPKRNFSFPSKEKYDFIFLTSKLYDMEKLVRHISKNKLNGKIVSNIQNGLVDCSPFEKILGKKILPVCVFGGFRIDKNKIFSSPTSMGWKTEFSRYGREISKVLLDCGVPCEANKQFDSLRAEKMIVNCCLNALSAIEKKQFNVLFSNKKTLQRIYRLFDECYQILSRKYPLESKEKLKRNMIKNWSNVRHFSSTYQDMISGRKTEIDFFNGYIIKLGKQYKLNPEENLKILEDFKKSKKEEK